MQRDPRQPIDLGMPSIGNLMRLMSALAVAVGLANFAIVGTINDALDRPIALPFVAIAALGAARVWMHRRAAARLVERSPEAPHAVRRYALTSLVATVAMVPFALMLTPHLGVVDASIALGGTLLWPLAILVWISRPAVRAAFAAAEAFEVGLIPRDRSIEGIGVVMLVFSAIGIGFALVFLIGAIMSFEIVSIVLGGALVARSSAHFRLGQLAADGTPPYVFPHAIRNYTGLAVLTALGFSILIFTIGGAFFSGLTAVALVVAFGIALLAWPRVVSRFADHALAQEQKLHNIPVGPAPDRGLVSLGALLLFLAIGEITVWLLGLAIGAVGSGRGATGLGIGESVSWLDLATLAAKIVAGVALVAMRGYRLAVLIYGVIALAATAYGWIRGGFDLGLGDGGAMALVALIGVAISVVVPIAALVLVRRELPAPERNEVLLTEARRVSVPMVARVSSPPAPAPVVQAAPPPVAPKAAPRPALASPRPRAAAEGSVMATFACACGWTYEAPRIFAPPTMACARCKAPLSAQA